MIAAGAMGTTADMVRLDDDDKNNNNNKCIRGSRYKSHIDDGYAQ